MEQPCGTSTTNNTSEVGSAKKKDIKKRGYFITFWDRDYPTKLPKGVQYLCTCEDHTEDGKYHGHAFIYYNNPVSMSNPKKLFGDDCHFKKIYKNSGCIDYVLGKIGKHPEWKSNFHEYGKKPMDNGKKVGDLKKIENPDELDYKMYNTWVKIQTEESNNLTVADFRKNVKVYWIQGDSGVGKTEKAISIIGEKNIFNDVKFDGNFWIGTSRNAKIALYDDFRDSHMKPSEFINFIDYNVHNLNIKGGSIKNKYETIIITSVQRLEDIYSKVSEEPRKQWERRIEVINMFKDEHYLEN